MRNNIWKLIGTIYSGETTYFDTVFYNPNGSVSSLGTYYHVSFHFDSANYNIKMEDDKLVFKYEIIINEQWNPVTATFYKNSDKLFTLDSVSFEYDRNNELIRKKNFHLSPPDSPTYIGYILFEYPDRNTVGEKSFSSDDKPHKVHTITYDTNPIPSLELAWYTFSMNNFEGIFPRENNILKVESYDIKNPISGGWDYEYEYNEVGYPVLENGIKVYTYTPTPNTY